MKNKEKIKIINFRRWNRYNEYEGVLLFDSSLGYLTGRTVLNKDEWEKLQIGQEYTAEYFIELSTAHTPYVIEQSFEKQFTTLLSEPFRKFSKFDDGNYYDVNGQIIDVIFDKELNEYYLNLIVLNSAYKDTNHKIWLHISSKIFEEYKSVLEKEKFVTLSAYLDVEIELA